MQEMVIRGVKMVGAVSVLVGGLFHFAGAQVFSIPVLGGALSGFWNFGLGPVTVQRLFGLIAVLYGANALGAGAAIRRIPAVGNTLDRWMQRTSDVVLPE